MATIYDRGDNWHLVIAPDADFVQKIDEPAKGYTANLGEDKTTGNHVVMDVHYDKKKYTIQDVMNFAEKTKNCPKCKALDKEKLNIDSIEIPNPTLPPQEITNTQPDNIQTRATKIEQPMIKRDSNMLKDMFSNVFMDAYLTKPGKYFLAMMTQDDHMLEQALPKTQAEIPDFMDEMIDFMSGKTDFVRSPDEIKEYLSILKQDNPESTKTATKKKKGSGMSATVIY